jgi:hypothetical protein
MGNPVTAALALDFTAHLRDCPLAGSQGSQSLGGQAHAGKCWDAVEKDLKLPKYESWPGYAQGLPYVLRRYCGLWGRGT